MMLGRTGERSKKNGGGDHKVHCYRKRNSRAIEIGEKSNQKTLFRFINNRGEKNRPEKEKNFRMSILGKV